jgi:hypothetical protein
MIAAAQAATELEKIRYGRFWLFGVKSNLWFYFRLDEGGYLTHRSGLISHMTMDGVALLASIKSGCYFMDFLLENKEGELAMQKRVVLAVQRNEVMLLRASIDSQLVINKTYKVVL